MDDRSFTEAAQFARAYQVSSMIHAVAEIGLADRIDHAPRPVGELASECGVRSDMLFRVCRALAAFGIYSVDREGRVGHTDPSRHFRSDASPTLHYAARYWRQDFNWQPWADLVHALRTGEPPFEARFGMPNFDYLAEHPEQSAIFDAFMQHSPDDRHAAVAEAYSFTGTVIDIAGGNGALLQAILSRHAGANGILFDLPSVTAGAGPLLEQFGARASVASGSFFEALPAGGDIYTISQILHDWSDERGLEILRNIRKAIRPEGKVLIIERILDDDPAGNEPMDLLTDMQMMVLFPGARERTKAEFGELLAQARFAPPRHIPTRSPFGILEAEAVP